MNIAKQTIDDILKRVDIVSIISNYLQLTKKGKDFICICPFHADSNPSLSISQSKQIFKCFSCGVGGNVISFVQNYEKIDFVSSIKKICDLANIEVEELKSFKQPKVDPDIQTILDINKFANDIFRLTIFSNLGLQAKEYLNNRNITDEQIKHFEIGFNSNKTNLVQKLLDQGFTTLQIEKSGLAIIENDYTKDYFANRIIFPIKDENNNIIGFSGRSIDKNIEPKYLNSKEKKVFKKSHLIYNVNQALKNSRLSIKIIILEGFMDVISLNKIEINNTIAIMGTALSEYHISFLKKHNLDVILFLDGDNPGIQATLKISNQLLRANIKTNIVDNQTNFDPDELINQNKIDYVKSIISNPISVLDYLINKQWEKINQTDFQEVEQFIKKISLFARAINNKVLDDIAINKIALKTNLSISTIQSAWTFDNSKKNSISQQKNKKSTIITKDNTKTLNNDIWKTEYIKAEQRILVSLLHNDKFIHKIHFNIDKIITPEIKHAISVLIKLYNLKQYSGNDIWKALDLLSENISGFSSIKDHITNNPMILDLDVTEKELDDIFYKLNMFHFKKNAMEFKNRILSTENEEQKEKLIVSIQKFYKKRGNE